MALKTSQMNYNKGKYHKNFDEIFNICSNCQFNEECNIKNKIIDNKCIIYSEKDFE